MRLASSALCTSWSAANHKRVLLPSDNESRMDPTLPTYLPHKDLVSSKSRFAAELDPTVVVRAEKVWERVEGRETQRDRNRNRDRSRLQGWGLGFVLSKWVFHGRVAGNFWLGTGEPHLNKAKIQGLKKLEQIEEIPTPHERWVLLHGKKKESSSYEVKFAECQIEETNKLCV